MRAIVSYFTLVVGLVACSSAQGQFIAAPGGYWIGPRGGVMPYSNLGADVSNAGPRPFTWYSVQNGYSRNYQNGLPWRGYPRPFGDSRASSQALANRSGRIGMRNYVVREHMQNDMYARTNRRDSQLGGVRIGPQSYTDYRDVARAEPPPKNNPTQGVAKNTSEQSVQSASERQVQPEETVVPSPQAKTPNQTPNSTATGPNRSSAKKPTRAPPTLPTYRSPTSHCP